MFVESVANRDARVESDTRLADVLRLLQDYPGLMVTNGDRVRGGLSRGALFHTFADYWMEKGASAEEILNRPVGDYAVEVPILKYGTPIEDAIANLVGGAPLAIVMDRREQPYGVISWLEINQYLREITGLTDPSSVRFSLALMDMPGQLARVAEVVGRAGVNITAMTLSDPKVLNWVHVVLRVDRSQASIARKALERAGIDIVAEH